MTTKYRLAFGRTKPAKSLDSSLRCSVAAAVTLWLASFGAAHAVNPPKLAFKPQTGLSFTGAVGTVYATLYTTNVGRSWRCLRFDKLPSSGYTVPGTAGTVCPVGQSRLYKVAAMSSTNLVYLSPGSFTMGSPTNEVGRFPDEGPQMPVTISKGIWMGKNLVTQREFQNVTGANPSSFVGDNSLPVDQVSWTEATNYCALRTQQEIASGLIPAGCKYRLPTEAEWEYACRAGTTTRFYYGDDSGYTALSSYAWYNVNSSSQTHPVGQKPANAWGLFDMHGNIWEWCQDWYGTYSGGVVTDPQGPATGDYRVLRGGSWADISRLCRTACRIADDPDGEYTNYGFRVVLAPSDP